MKYAHLMDPLEFFYAMRTGEAQQTDGSPATLRVAPLGMLEVPSGLLEASDPFVTLGEGPVLEVEPGSYEAFVTIADVSEEQDGSHEREAYLSIVLRDGVVTSAGTVSLQESEPDSYWAVAVDAGTVAFADHEAVGVCMPSTEGGDTWYENVFETGRDDSWFALMDSEEHGEPGMANIVMPLASRGENIVLTHSGWGDGFYPVIVTLDSEGNILGVHIDLLVVGQVDPDEDNDGEDSLQKVPEGDSIDDVDAVGTSEISRELSAEYASPFSPPEVEDVRGRRSGFLRGLFSSGK